MRLLIIGELDGYISAASKIAIDHGADVIHVDGVMRALASLRAGHGADLIMIDVTLNVRTLIENLKSERINAPVVACGIGADTPAAVAAIKAGAKEYVPLPPDADLISAIFEAVTEENSTIVHSSAAIVECLRLADQIAPSEASVLIVGPSGTGKELFARRIHRKSRRAKQKFVPVNCAAIPENLLESELFGHERGAFTGAVARRIGKFEEASGGTLLLDEISEMATPLQAKLLRAIQEREIDRVGGNRPVKIDIRILATTNRNLAEEVRAGRFREDLYYRLNVVTLELPPLKGRPEDIDTLARHFARKYAEVNGVENRALTDDALERLHQHDWPGNIRELENTMHRAVLLGQGEKIDGSAIVITDGLHGQSAAEVDASAAAETLVGRTVADVERDLILETLGHYLGNRTHAANILGISIRTLRNKLKQYSDQGIKVPMPGAGERVSV